MRAPVICLLRNRSAFWDALREGGLGWLDLAKLVLFVVAACAVYGAVLAGWRSPRLSLYVAIKLPVLFLGTTAVVARCMSCFCSGSRPSLSSAASYHGFSDLSSAARSTR